MEGGREGREGVREGGREGWRERGRGGLRDINFTLDTWRIHDNKLCIAMRRNILFDRWRT